MKENLTQQVSEVDYIDFDQLESALEQDLTSNLQELEGLELDHQLIGNPDGLGETVQKIVWEQFVNQVGVVAGEDFIKENRGLTLDLRDSAHIQTVENFKEGKIATHNHYSKNQLERNYSRYKHTLHKDFRDKFVEPNMDEVLPRIGTLKAQGQETVKDIYTGRQISTQYWLEDGSYNPLHAQREHVISSNEIYQNATLQMGYDDESLAAIINHPENLQGYTTAQRNNRKSDRSKEEMGQNDKNKHWEKANERAEKLIQNKEQEATERLESEGRATQKQEAFRITGKALRAVLMGMLAALVKEIIQKIIAWFRSANKQFKTFIESIKEAISNFITNLKQHLLTAGDTLITTITTAIFGPVISLIKKAWIFLKQGFKSIKEAIIFLKDPANKNMPFSLKLLHVGKILIAGLTAGGAIVLGEVIEKGLLAIPVFAIQIPLFGSLANILGVFFGALVSGIIGALALNLIDRLISQKIKQINLENQVTVKNEIIVTQEKLIQLAEAKTTAKADQVYANIEERHKHAASEMKQILTKIADESIEKVEKESENKGTLDEISNMLDNL